MTVKRQLVADIEALPDDLTAEEAVERLYQIYRIKKGLAAWRSRKADDLSEESGPREEEPAGERKVSEVRPPRLDTQEARLLQLIEQERIEEARQLAARLDIPHWARVLAPPVITVAETATGSGITSQAAAAEQSLDRYAGQWVALHDGRVIDADPRRGELHRRLQAKGLEAGTVFMKVES